MRYSVQCRVVVYFFICMTIIDIYIYIHEGHSKSSKTNSKKTVNMVTK